MGSSEGFCSCTPTSVCWYCTPEPRTTDYCVRCGDSPESAPHYGLTAAPHDYEYPRPSTTVALSSCTCDISGYCDFCREAMRRMDGARPVEESDTDDARAIQAIADEMDEKDNRISELEGLLDQKIAQREEDIRQRRYAEQELTVLRANAATKDDQIADLYEEIDRLREEARLAREESRQSETRIRISFATGWSEGVAAGNEAGEITGYARGWADAVDGAS